MTRRNNLNKYIELFKGKVGTMAWKSHLESVRFYHKFSDENLDRISHVKCSKSKP